MKRKLLFIILLFTGIIGKNCVYAQEDMFKALFMYNFTKDIEWPTSLRQGDFKILVLGSSDIIGELEKIGQKKKVGNQPIVVQKINDASEITTAHIVYITPAKSSQLNDVLSKTASSPILVITDKDGLAKQGSCINYVKIDGKQKFEICPANINNRGLKVNSFLMSLGIEIN